MSVLIIGILLPLAGTMLGSAFVFFMRKDIPDRLQKTLFVVSFKMEQGYAMSSLRLFQDLILFGDNYDADYNTQA